MRFLILILTLLVSPLLKAADYAEVSNDAQYEFGVATCNGGDGATCRIIFETAFSSTPLIFVMPTIDPVSLDDDLSANLSVIAVVEVGAIVKQEMPSLITGNTEPMTSISYLAIEPGFAQFPDGKVVYAGYSDLNNKVWFNSATDFNSSDWKTVAFDDMPMPSNDDSLDFSSSNQPVVLTEVQSRNNGDKWITTAQKLASNGTGIQLSLELSRSKNGDAYENETIAYLLADPRAGFSRGYDFSFSRYNSQAVSGSTAIADSCIDYSDTGLSFVEGAIGSKQQRIGSHGGWLRRCRIQDGKVSFVVDEDDRDRTHLAEQVGYFAFNKTFLTDFEVCSVFPEPAQSWNSGSTLTIQQQATTISGWSGGYVDSNLIDGDLNIGFDNVIDNSNASNSCDVGQCASSGSRVSIPSYTEPSFTSTKVLELGNSDQIIDKCTGEYCDYTVDSEDNYTVTIKDHLQELVVDGSTTVNFATVLGEDGLKIQEYQTYGSVTTQFKNPGTYSFESVSIHDSATLETGSEVVWKVTDSIIFHNKMTFVNTATPDDFIIFAPTADIKFSSANDSGYYGLILADTVTLGQSTTINGAVTTNNLLMSSSNTAIIGDSECIDSSIPPPPSKSYTINVTEKYEFALLCDNPEFTFTITDNDTDDVAEEFSGNIQITLPDNVTVNNVVTGSGADGVYQAERGVLVLELASSNYGEYSITGALDTGESDQASLYIAPYIFDSETVYATAGQDTSFHVEVTACKDGTSTSIPTYSGDKNIALSELSLRDPSVNEGANEGDLKINGETLSSSIEPHITLSFSNEGEATGSVNYDESGTITFLLSDDDFVCPEEYDCRINDESWGGLTGNITVNVRPWTFAICDPNDLAVDGTSSSGSAYKAAGEAFSLYVKPIVYTSNGTTDPDDRCSAQVTTNFFNSNAPAATVYLRGELDTPSAGKIGTGSAFIIENDNGDIISSGQSLSHFSNSGTASDPYYKFSNLYWNEVGSLSIAADIDDIESGNNIQYLGGSITTGTRDIGRFVPDHLTIIEDSSTLWDYADSHLDFAYMDQSIGHHFTVQAESSNLDSDGDALVTTNYGLFVDAYLTDITYKVTANLLKSDGSDDWQNVESNRLYSSQQLDWGGSDWGETSGQLVVDISDFTFVKDGANLDGPYSENNADFGLVSSKVDDVDFNTVDFDATLTGSDSGKLFVTQPDFRYGRMVLDDVGGNEGDQINIPLRVEYWDTDIGDFIQNSEDSGSVLNSNEYCSISIWADGASSNISLSGASSDTSVLSGGFSALEADLNGSGREQFKIWLRQGISLPSQTGVDCSGSYVNQPWLQYYWDGITEEDPSATITFGIHRGNDRIIFRGENRFIGQ